MDKSEMRAFVMEHRHGQLWETLKLNLSLEEEKAQAVATHVAFTLAGGKVAPGGAEGTITQDQFVEFKKKWVDNPHGNREFMLRTVFTSQDTDMNGYLDQDELDGLASLFFDGSWISADDPRMKHFKDKEHFKQIINEKCDLDKDGKFSYDEIVGIISGKLDLSDTHTAKDEVVDRILAKSDPNHSNGPWSARHLLIKFGGSRNPTSRRTNQSTKHVTAEAAQTELQQYAEKINAEGATEQVFSKYAKERSDCGSFNKGGDLGPFGTGEMQKQFEDATKALQVGKMSENVLSDSGYHLIFRTA